MGAMMGIDQKKYKYNTIWDASKLFVCIVAFYAIFALKVLPAFCKLQYFSIIPLVGVVFYFYKLCNSEMLKKAYYHHLSGFLIRLIGGLCLEIYLVQSSLFTDKMNSLFPLNIFVMFVIIVGFAYIVRCASRLFAQTFRDMEYNWKEIVKI